MTSTLLKFPSLHAPVVKSLPNGLTIVAQQMPIEAVNLNLWVKVGSAVESDAINGMTHFLEHMIFKGTELLPSGEFERRIEERGAVTNAATGQDYTHFYITTAPKDFADLAPMHINLVRSASIRDEGFERERFVILEEIRRSSDNPNRRTYQRAMETAFDRLPYRRSVLGPEAVISQLQAAQMRDFHATWYQPRFMTAVAVGNLPESELMEIVTQGFENTTPVSGRDVPAERLYDVHPEPAFTEIVRQEFVDESLTQARLVMVWRVPGLERLHQTYALDVLAGILGHGWTSRLVRDLREERKLVSHISVSNITQELQGIFYISAQCEAENLAVVEAHIAQHIRCLQTELATEAEIARVRTREANRFIFAHETPSDRASLYGYYQTLLGNLEGAFNYPAYIQAQEATDLMQAAQNYLSPDAYGVVAIKPH
ncbi:M16 family metallopeptidase [Iningainema tapete]|uniref:Insulinase family protein n=1 Tax=Iningainema tapete BLCC-T55 TaxID=2748662 RepID=A0A8J6XTT4_9CYAN|nr:pitrilysin family protein [Iningainema tapete]MBD2773743.1 insulinase family protein [Iningainema tapete BLCC-T55]